MLSTRLSALAAALSLAVCANAFAQDTTQTQQQAIDENQATEQTMQDNAAPPAADPYKQDPVDVAENGPPDSAPEAVTLQSLDKNADGGVSKDELPPDHAITRDFAKFDSDADGKLSQSEFDAANK